MKRTYYYLPLGSDRQPDGNVKEIKLTKEEYAAYSTDVHSDYFYIYKCYSSALNRAHQ